MPERQVTVQMFECNDCGSAVTDVALHIKATQHTTGYGLVEVLINGGYTMIRVTRPQTTR